MNTQKHKAHKYIIREAYKLKSAPSVKKCPICSPDAIVYKHTPQEAA